MVSRQRYYTTKNSIIKFFLSFQVIGSITTYLVILIQVGDITLDVAKNVTALINTTSTNLTNLTTDIPQT